MKEELHVLVLVTFRNELRQQKNLFIGTLNECMEEVNRLFTNIPIYTYDDVNTSLALELEYKEKVHYWLQKF